MNQPFSYSAAAHSRRHGPAGYEDYAQFKPWLRDEFLFRCVYCLFRERWYPSGADNFGVDHVLPKSSHPEKTCDYDNLVYACNRCNSDKGVVQVLDPCRDGLAAHVTVEADGTVKSHSRPGAILVDVLDLNSPRRIEFRRWVLELAKKPDLFIQQGLMGYPDGDLEDLGCRKPPGGNQRPGGVAASVFHRRRTPDFVPFY